MKELKQNKYSNEEITEKLCPKFDDTKSQSSAQSDIDARRLVVITSYNSASYQIESILWDETPQSITFEWKERDPVTKNVTKSKVTLAEYMQRKYKIRLENWELNQPILKLQQRGQDILLIPSRCHEASLPAGFTKDANKMRDLRTYMITEPKDRFNRISSLIESFAKSDKLGEWQMKVNENFTSIVAKQLFHPGILDP